MAVNDQAQGPKIGQVVVYNNGGTEVPAMIYAIVSPGGPVSLQYLASGGWTNVASSTYDSNRPPANGKWTYHLNF